MTTSLDDDLLTGSSVLFARQPVFNKNQDVEAYGLMYRTDDGSLPEEFSDEQATASVILNSYSIVSDEREEKHVPLYVKLTESMLLSDMLPALPKDGVIFELLREEGISKELVSAVRARKQDGYRFALTHFTGDKAQTALLDVVHVVKIDIQRHTEDELRQMVRFVKPYHVDILADKVESQADFARCIDLGFNLFQGYFLCKPLDVKGKSLSGSKAILFELMKELDNPNATASSVEQIVINDPVMTYKVLKLVNSAAFSTSRQIESISHAVAMIGMEQIKKWTTLLLLSGQSGKPVELTRIMLTRGRMCELLAEMLGYDAPINYFMVGLLSQLDAMMDMEMTALMQQVPLTDDIKEAILTKTNQMGAVLKDVIHYERAEWDALLNLLSRPHYEVAYRHSLQWSQQVLSSLED